MTYNKKTAIWLFILYAAMILFACIMESCRTEHVVTVPEYHEHVVHQHDTLIQRDTIQHERKTVVREVDAAVMAEYGIRLAESQRAWLVQTEELRREISRLQRNRADTVAVHDSVPYPVEVEKPLSRWQRLSLRTGSVVLRLLALAVGGGFLFLLVRLLLRHVFRQ